jgi:glyoxylase-like metal-dependent hydrolase (beta-lactamase superfamily II)
MCIFTKNSEKVIFHQTDFDAIKAVEKTPEKKSIDYQGHSYVVLSQKVQTYTGFLLLCRRVFAIFMITITLGILLNFKASKEWISDFWNTKKVYFFITSTIKTDHGIELENWTIFPLLDGHIDLPLKKMFCDKKAKLQRLSKDQVSEQLKKSAIETTGDDLVVKTKVNTFLAVSKIEKKYVLIDTGCGKHCQTAGNLKASLESHGFTIDQITDVLITHLHYDHAGGLRKFPNATIHISDIESRNDDGNYLEGTEGRVKKFEFKDRQNEVFVGIKAIHAPGHTEGHAVFLIDDQLLILGDVVHNEAIQYRWPNIAVSYDLNGDQAIQTRHALFDKAIQCGLRVLGSHTDGVCYLYADRSDPKNSRYFSHSTFLDKVLEFLPSLEERNTKKLMGLNVYPICNETNLDAVYKDLHQFKKPGNESVHIGCAGWYNFDVMAIRQSAYGIVFDINKDSTDFMKMTVHLLKEKQTKEEFEKSILEYMLGKQNENSKTFFCKHDFETSRNIPLDKIIEHEKSRKNSWLYSETSYGYIRNLVLGGKLAVIQQDSTNSAVFKTIKKKLTERGCSVDTVYASNIADFIPSEHSKDFVDSITGLLDDESILISSPSLVNEDKYGKTRIHQVTLKGAEVKRNASLLFTNSKSLIEAEKGDESLASIQAEDPAINTAPRLKSARPTMSDSTFWGLANLPPGENAAAATLLRAEDPSMSDTKYWALANLPPGNEATAAYLLHNY